MSVVDLGDAAASESPDTIDLRARKSTPLAEMSERLAKRTTSQGYALVGVSLPDKAGAPAGQRILFPVVSVDPGEPERRSSVYYGPPFDGVPKQAPMVSAVDPEELQPLSAYVLATTEATYARECLLPRAAAVRARGKAPALLVACFGIDAVLELDALAVDPFRAERRRFDVPPGPEGLAVDEAVRARGGLLAAGRRASASCRSTGRSAPAPSRSTTGPTRPSPPPRGAGCSSTGPTTRASPGDGIACSSCHVDGSRGRPHVDDADGSAADADARRPPRGDGALRLGGRSHDARRLHREHGGAPGRQGPAARGPRRPRELPARGPAATARGAGRDRAREPRARALRGSSQGCTTCHAGGATDATSHGFSGGKFDAHASFDTPSLRFVRGTAPYFHDGRYDTLEALLADPTSAMGHTASLPEGDRAALAAYLRSL